MSHGGITQTGFVLPRLPELREESVVIWRGLFGANADTSPESNDGLEIDFHIESLAKVWEAAFAAYSSAFLSSATGASLDRLLALFAFPRLQAEPSQVTERLYGVAATVIPAGSVITVTDTELRFLTSAEVTIPAIGTQAEFIATTGGMAEADEWELDIDGETSTVVAPVGGYTAALAIAAMASVLGGNSKVSTTEQLLADPLGNGVLVVTMTSALTYSSSTIGSVAAFADPYGDVLTESEDDGEISAEAETLRVIASPVTGWRGAYNDLTADPGRLTETDEEYRSRWLLRSSGQGLATVDAISRFVQDSDPTIEDVSTLENTTDVVDANGLPAHSVRPVVLGGVDETIFQAVWDSKGGGIATSGTEVGTAIDVNGDSHTVAFSRPEERFVWIVTTITPGEGFPTSSTDDEIEAQIAAALVVYGTALGMGRDINDAEVTGVITRTITGISEVSTIYGTKGDASTPSPPLTSGTVSIDVFQISRWAASRISVTIL